jgi:hypothetical protein
VSVQQENPLTEGPRGVFAGFGLVLLVLLAMTKKLSEAADAGFRRFPGHAG